MSIIPLYDEKADQVVDRLLRDFFKPSETSQQRADRLLAEHHEQRRAYEADLAVIRACMERK